MGLFDFFSGGRGKASSQPKGISQRELARLTRIIGDKLAQDYDREEAIVQLSKLGNADGVRALLKRFDFALQASIRDRDEKERVVEGIVAAGEAALEPLRAYCANASSLSWPIRILRRIVSEERVIDELLAILDQFDTEYIRDAEPKIDLIKYLEDHPHPDVREAVEPFLSDVNEAVRFHAAGTIIAMGDPKSTRAFVAALEEEESLRVKNRIAGALAERQWEIPEELRELAADHLPPNFTLTGNRVVASG